MITAAVWLSAYLLGSIPFGVLMAKLRKVDLRQHGSGNIGATNVARTLGNAAGLLTLAGDCGKGYLACWIAEYTLATHWEIAIAGLLAFLGHVFSVFLKFRGGKGVATGLGIFLYLMPQAGLASMGVFILLLLATRYVSLGSMIAAFSVPLVGWWLKAPVPYIAISLVAAGMTLFKHRENLQRLMQGTESKFMKK